MLTPGLPDLPRPPRALVQPWSSQPCHSQQAPKDAEGQYVLLRDVYTTARLKAYVLKYPRPALTNKNRIGMRAWGKLHSMRVIAIHHSCPGVREYMADMPP